MENIFNFKQARIITNDSIRFSTSELRISTNSISFNAATAAELGYPQDITIFADTKNDGRICLCITPWDPAFGENAAMPFFDRETASQANKRIVIKHKDFVSGLRADLSIDDKKGRKVFGVFYRNDNMLYFDLSKAVLTSVKTPRKAASLANFPSVAEIMATARPIPLALPG